MSVFVREKDFYKLLITISVPIALQNLVDFGLNMMDTVMLGRLGEKVISASAIANQPYFIFTVFLFGLASGASVLTAQYWGKGDTGAISRILSISMKAAVLCSLLFGLVVVVFPAQVMGLYTSDMQVIAYGTQFLRIIGYSYILSAISQTYLYILRSVENVTLPLTLNFIAFVVNIALNWVLIFGKFGIKPMGIRGSATATLCARALTLVLTCVYAFCFDKKLQIKLKEFLNIDRVLLGDFIRYSAPVVINETLWALGSSMQSVIVGHISSEAVAANSIAGVLQRLSTVAIIGISNFTAIAVGKQIGAGNVEKARNYAAAMLRLSVAVGLCSFLLILFLRDPFLALYDVGEKTQRYTYEIMTVFAFQAFFACFNYTCVIGVLRGGGDSRFALLVDVVTMWTVAIPVGAVAGLILKWPLPVVFVLLTIDEPIKIFIGFSRFKSGKWLRNVTR